MNDIKHPQLIVVSELSRGTLFSLVEQRYLCGRSDSNDIVLNDNSVSTNHCELFKNGNTYIIRDTGSANGIRVNGVSLEETKLKNNDIVNIGGVELLYDAQTEEKKGVPTICTGIDPDMYNSKMSTIVDMKNNSPFVKNKNRLPLLAITTVIIFLMLITLGLLVWLFSLFFSL